MARAASVGRPLIPSSVAQNDLAVAMERLVSILGLFVMIGLAWLMSSHRSRVNWRLVGGGLLLQFTFAVLILMTKPGQLLFEQLDTIFVTLLSFVDVGSEFVFGPSFRDHFIAFSVLPTIIFFSAFMSIFYYYGVMQWIVGLFARLMQKSLGTSGAETLSAAANVFVGQTEAPLVIRPYIDTMTISELNAVMVGGFATIAGGVLAAYVDMGVSAQHLLAASVISAPAALLIAKVMQPEVEEPKTLGHVALDVKDPSSNVLEAIANGTTGGLKLALNVAAMLLVFMALVAVVNGLVGWLGIQLGYGSVDDPMWSLEAVLSYLFAPLAWVMGIEWKDCFRAGELLGLKMATNEFVAYARLSEWQQPDSAIELTDRTKTILTYALCGFANFSSIGIQLGGIGGIAPNRSGDLAKLGFRAMLGGTLAAFMTACVAGLLIS